MTEPTELLPCPFCGGDARHDAHADDCYFILHRKFKNSGADMSPALEVLAAWNRRVAPATMIGEPVFAFRRKGLNDFCTCTGERYAELSLKPKLFETRIFYTTPQPTQAQAGAVPLTDEQIDAVAESMPGGLDGFLKGWGWRQFAREILTLRRMPDWEPQFDCMTPKQEELAVQFCQEIAGPRGKRGSPPDPVRLLEMAEALYKAEREHHHGIKGGQHGAE